MFVKYAGLTVEAAKVLELNRVSPDEQESDIIVRLATSLQSPTVRHLGLGQGVKVIVGEKLYLFLDEQAKRQGKPNGVADVKADGLYVEARKIRASKNSLIQPAMRHFQDKLGRHTSLNAYKQWNVLREGKWVRLDELKDPSLARKRSRDVLTLADLNL